MSLLLYGKTNSNFRSKRVIRAKQRRSLGDEIPHPTPSRSDFEKHRQGAKRHLTGSSSKLNLI